MVKSNGVDKFELMRGYSNPLNLLEESFVVHIIDITCVAGNFVCAMTITAVKPREAWDGRSYVPLPASLLISYRKQTVKPTKKPSAT